MNRWITRGVVVSAALGLTLSGLGAAQAASSTTIRQADLVGDSVASGAASYNFLAEGLVIKVPDTGPSFARGVWKAGYALSTVTTIGSDWIGTVGRPAIRIDVDLDGDGKPDGQLVSEQAYGNQDVWLNRDIGDYNGVTPTLAADTFKNAAPCNGATAATGVTDPCGSSGSTFHGTLANWATRLAAVAPTGKTPTIVTAGFGASGVVQEGVLRSATVGTNEYLFTSAAAPVVTPPVVTAPAKTTPALTVSANKRKVGPGGKVKFDGTVKSAGTAALLTLQRKQNGKWRTKASFTLPSTGAFSAKVKAPKTLGKAKFRAVLSETATTLPVTSNVIKVKVLPRRK